MVQILRIDMNDPLYSQELALRENVLLRPLGLDLATFQAEFAGVEEQFEHFVALFAHPRGPRVIGCVTFLSNHPKDGVGQLMQMAVDPQRQGEGIGRKLVVAVESRAFGEMGLSELICHARADIVQFYERLGWQVTGEAFTEVGVEHRPMGIFAETDAATGSKTA